MYRIQNQRAAPCMMVADFTQNPLRADHAPWDVHMGY